MGQVIVKLVADISPELKDKIKKIAVKKEISIKELLIQVLKNFIEEEEQKEGKKKSR